MNNRYMSNNIERNATWRVGVYCRLSKDDELTGESASISNQRDILVNYCQSQGWQVVDVFQDDGYTGLNTDRPDLQRLLKACEKGLVNLVITKDQSRLGRNHVQTGFLMEEFFPKHGVRYIALYDNVDTFAGDNEIAPFKNVLNEMYSRDISKKVHASYHLQATKGKFTGVVPPLGYQKDPEEKGHLLIDDETAPIVRKIFQWAVDGHGINFISRELERQQIPCPSWWHRKRGLRTYYTKWEKKDPENGKYVWDESYLKSLLMNPVYCGDMASQKRYYRFKIGNQGDKAPEDWITVRDTHEAIIDEETFELVQKFISVKKQPNKTGRPNIFVGLVKCPDCGRNMAFSNPNGREPRFRCRTYVRNSNLCTTHAISYEALQQIVMSDIQKHIKNMEALGDQFIQEMHELSEKGGSKKIKQFEKDLEVAEKRIAEIDSVIMKLFEQNALGKISDERFEKMSSAYESEQKELAQKRDELRTKIRAEEKKTQSTNQFLETIRKYETVTELNRSMLVELIDSIYVYQAEGTGKDRKQRVEINYRFLAGSQCGIA